MRTDDLKPSAFVHAILGAAGYRLLRLSFVRQLAQRYPELGAALGETLPQWGATPAGPSPDLRLSFDAPALRELETSYAAHPAAAVGLWGTAGFKDDIALQGFRGDNRYVWQGTVAGPMQYLIACDYLVREDRLGLFDRLEEDGAYGAQLFDYNGRRLVSRDLIDSVLELNFLERAIGVSGIAGLRVLDIGAGYGRMGHRMAAALPGLAQYLGTDAVPLSSYICDAYLRMRGVGERARAVRLTEIEAAVVAAPPDLALNIHSFSETALGSIRWWLALLRNAGVRHFMIVSNDGERFLSTEADGSRLDFAPEIEAAGYRLADRADKYHGAPQTQRYGLYPAVYHLFSRP